MSQFWALIKLSWKEMIRSRMFWSLSILLFICIIWIPSIVQGDGSPEGLLRIQLEYNFNILSLILALSSLLTGCWMQAHEIETKRIQILISKSISRYSLWTAKWIGVFSFHILLLILALILLYGSLWYQYQSAGFSEKEQKRIEREVLTGRRPFWPQKTDFQKLAKAQYEQKCKENPEYRKQNGADENVEIYNIQKKLIDQQSEIPFRYTKEWSFTGFPKLPSKTPLAIRFRCFVDEMSAKDSNQRPSSGLWILALEMEKDPDYPDKPPSLAYYPRTSMPEVIQCNKFQEILAPSNAISSSGELKLAFQNWDNEEKSLHFHPIDGPQILVPIASFLENYIYGSFCLFLQIAVFSLIGCAFGSVFSFPSAIFCSCTYLFFGAVCHAVLAPVEFNPGYMLPDGDKTINDYIGLGIAHTVVAIVPSPQAFTPGDSLANGILIEYKLIFSLFFYHLLLRTMPIVLFSLYFYQRREFALSER